jgi:hypothetical protein
MRNFFVALIVALSGAFVLTPGAADAHHSFGSHHVAKKKHSYRHHHVRKHSYRHYRVVKKRHAQHRKSRAGHSVSLAGVTPVLAAKTRQIVATCGSTVISAVSARGNRSNHPIGRAVDLRGNPGCIYAQLKGWPGGYSTDYAAAQHVHISYNPGGQEWGLRFAHGSSRSVRATRYARLGPRRYPTQQATYANAMYGTDASSRRRATRATRQTRRDTSRYVSGTALHSVH